ncbi:MAG TPA: carbohydrate-binding protein [Tepidisphaeraceae bacterium]|nr:carbohydrate-binding protein [Tepidisphaeraceae bacterium]
MLKNSKLSSSSSRGSVRVESLEERRLLAWGPVDTQIGLDRARATYPAVTGAGQTVAVIDSGTNFSAPVLQGKFAVNAADPVDGRDNDGNGYADDYRGWNFANGNNNATDRQGHGTMVSGTIAAGHYVNTGNPYQAGSADYKEYEGVAPGARLLALKIADTGLSFNVAHLEKALQYVVANRVKFNITAVNLSLGVSSAQYAMVSDELTALDKAGVFIASPSGFGPSMSVGMTNASGAVIGGNGAQVVAPGSGVVVLDMSGQNRFWVGGTGYSYASPFVTGAAALVKQINPRFTAAQVQAILADSGQVVSGYKRLDVAAAIRLAYQRAGATAPAPSPVPTPAPTPTTRSPFSGTPVAAPNWVEAENFDNGAAGVTHYDTTAGNSGGYHRATNVDIGKTPDAGGGYEVHTVKAGEWLEYTVTVPTAGTYMLEARLSGLGTGATFHVNVDGVNKTGAMAVPNTGAWSAYRTVSKGGISLTAGKHVVRVAFDTNGSSGYVMNLNKFRLVAQPQAPLPSGPVATTGRSAFGAIKASTFTAQRGLTYNAGGIGSVDTGDYAGYHNVNFGTAGATRFDVNVAVPAAFAGKKIVVRLGSPTGTVVGRLTVKSTGAWGAYQTQSVAITRVTGVQNVYLTFEGGAGVGNVGWFKFA